MTGGASPAGQPTGAAGLNPSAAGGAGGSGFSGGGTGLSGGSTGFSGGGTGLSGGGTGLSGGGTGLSGVTIRQHWWRRTLRKQHEYGARAGSLSPQNAPQQGLQAGSGRYKRRALAWAIPDRRLAAARSSALPAPARRTRLKNSTKRTNTTSGTSSMIRGWNSRARIRPAQRMRGLTMAAPRAGQPARRKARLAGLQGSQNPQRPESEGNQNPGTPEWATRITGNISGRRASQHTQLPRSPRNKPFFPEPLHSGQSKSPANSAGLLKTLCVSATD